MYVKGVQSLRNTFTKIGVASHMHTWFEMKNIWFLRTFIVFKNYFTHDRVLSVAPYRSISWVLQGLQAYKQTNQFIQWQGFGVILVRSVQYGWWGGAEYSMSAYLACCLQRGQRGQWTMQLEELLDKLRGKTKKQKKHDIAINTKHVMLKYWAQNRHC